jgi:hypothetical protein
VGLVALLAWRLPRTLAGAARTVPPQSPVPVRAAQPLPQARRTAQLPRRARREPPGGLHLHFPGLDAAQVAAIISRRQEGRRCEPGRLAARQAHMPTRAAQALTGRMKRPWRWWLRGAGYVLLVAAISYGLLWLVLV